MLQASASPGRPTPAAGSGTGIRQTARRLQLSALHQWKATTSPRLDFSANQPSAEAAATSTTGEFHPSATRGDDKAHEHSYGHAPPQQQHQQRIHNDTNNNSSSSSIDGLSSDNTNIDQALRSLYDIDDDDHDDDDDDCTGGTSTSCFIKQQQYRRRPSFSFVAVTAKDWLLDGCNEQENAAVEESHEMWQELYPVETADEWLQNLARMAAQATEQSATAAAQDENESDADATDCGIGEDFGDFQSATHDEQEALTGTATSSEMTTEPVESDTTRIPSRVPSPYHEGTPELIQRADDILYKTATTASTPRSSAKSPDEDDDEDGLPLTPVLVQQTQDLLQAAASGYISNPSPVRGPVTVAWSPVRPVSLDCPSLFLDHTSGHDDLHGNDDDDYVPISLQLPVGGLLNMEGRFTRRRQLHRKNKSVGDRETSAQEQKATELAIRNQLQDLPSYYFNQPNLDDTVRVLETLPWKHVQLVQSTLSSTLSSRDGRLKRTARIKSQPPSPFAHVNEYNVSELDLWDEHMTDQLCHLDAALETVKSELLTRVQPHESALQAANGLVHELEQNLRLASMYWERAHASVAQAMGSQEDGTGVTGSIVLLQAWQQQEEYEELSGTLDQVANVMAKEQEVCRRIDTFDARQDNAVEEYYALIKLTKDLQATVCDGGPLSGLLCLDEMRARLRTIRKRFWHRLHVLSESVAVRCCRGMPFDWIEYESLVQSVLDLHSKGIDEESSDDIDLGQSWSDNIVDALCFEADRAFAIALLDPVDSVGSEFEKELRLLAREVDLDWGDGAKLRTLTHNLVTIRFDFESQSSYLPRVFHRLCIVLSEVLHSHFLFTQWHATPFDDQSRRTESLHKSREQSTIHVDGALGVIDCGLKAARTRLWNHCELVIVKCFEEYLNFATKRKLFEQEAGFTEDSAWRQDLDALHQVLILADRFVSLKSSFFQETGVKSSLVSLRDDAVNWALYDKLSDIFRKHLRSVHVEAMNTMGRMLANETWRLACFTPPSDTVHTPGTTQTIENMLLHALNTSSSYRNGSNGISWEDVVVTDEQPWRFNRFARDGNPFDAIESVGVEFIGFDSARVFVNKAPSDVHEAVTAIIQDCNGNGARVAPESVSQGLVVWLSRILTVVERLPLISEDVSAVFANLSDLYFATVLRLCVGSARDERIILGIDEPSPLQTARSDISSSGRKSPRPNSPLFGFSRKGNGATKSRHPPRPHITIPLSLEADVSAPLSRDEPITSQLKQYIQRAQRSLQDIVNLDRVDQWITDPVQTDETIEEHLCAVARTLEKREAALCSCYIVAALFDVAYSIAAANLSSPFLRGKFVEELSSLKSFVRTTMEITPFFVTIASQISCTRAVGGIEVVKEIIKVGAGWEECQLNENPNDYVDDLCDRCALVWGFLAASAKLPSAIMTATWEHMMTGAYLSLLEGFARVPYCSTEGRALMTLDLASFSAGTGRISIAERLEGQALPSTIPKVNPVRGMRYVDTYIKVFYYPKEDVVRWTEHNFRNYRLIHCLALVTAAGDSPGPTSASSQKNLFNHVKSLYRPKIANKEEEKKV